MLLMVVTLALTIRLMTGTLHRDNNVKFIQEFVLLPGRYMLFHNRPRADIKPVIVVRKIRGKVVKFGSSGIKLVPLEAVDLSNSRIFGLIKLDFPFLSGSDYITSCCIGLLLFG